MTDLNSFSTKFRNQLTFRYEKALREGALTVTQIQQLLQQLQIAFEKAEKSKRRVTIKDQDSSWSLEEIQDQISSLRQVLAKIR